TAARKEAARAHPRHSDRASPAPPSDAPHQAIADAPAGQVGQATKTEWDPTVMSEVGVAEATPLGQECVHPGKEEVRAPAVGVIHHEDRPEIPLAEHLPPRQAAVGTGFSRESDLAQLRLCDSRLQ